MSQATTTDGTAATPIVTTTRRGVIHTWTRTLIPTAKQPPAEAEAASHQLLARAGYIKRVAAGIYDYLPLAWRVLQKISQIVREEMDGAGAGEMLMPVAAPLELLEATGRADSYPLFRYTDQHGREGYLCPTHEEVITELLKSAVNSYKQLPLNLYQIQTKFRDEFRPRAGLLRCREFVMKDAYSFHTKIEGRGGLNETYDAMYGAYERAFRRCGLDFSIVEAESGPIGGSASHEFMVNAASGEDTILVCPETGYAANVEKCAIGARPEPSGGWFAGEPTGDLEEVHTPDRPGIEEVCKVLKVKAPNMLKTVEFRAAGGEDGRHGRWIVAVVRGDHEVNEGKVRDAVGGSIELANPVDAVAAGFQIGYVSPRAALGVEDALLLVDHDAATGFDEAKGKPMFWAAGADTKDHHVKHFNWRRELGDALADGSKVRVAEIRNAMAGDPSPRAEGAALEAQRGIEVGHIFKLGDKYSRALGFDVLDEDQARKHVIMGCYGIGVSRTMAACVEMSHDDHGIVWPANIAPYHVLITPMDVDPDSAVMKAACDISGRLMGAGFDVLVDDRDERPGVKFKDADLIGVPLRLTIGDKALAEGAVEFKRRTDPGKGELVKVGDVVDRCLAAVNG